MTRHNLSQNSRPFASIRGCLFLLLTLPSLALDSRHTYTAPAELHGFGDFNGDSRLDVVIIDRATGNARFGTQQPDGSLNWPAALPTGVPAAEAFAVGPITATANDQLVVTGTSANAVHILDPATATTFIRPTRVLPTGIGPGSVGAFDFPGAAGNDPALLDLAVTTSWNNSPNTDQRHLLQSLPAGISPLSNLNMGSPADRGSRVLTLNAGPERYAHISRTSPTNIFRIFDTSAPTFPQLTSAAGLPAECEFVHGPFITATNRHQFVFWVPGDTSLTTVRTDPGGALLAPVTHSLGASPIEGVYLTDDGTTTGVLVIFNAGTSGAFYALDSGGVPVLGQAIVPPAGSILTGTLAYKPGRLSILLTEPGERVTRRMQDYTHDGMNWVPGAVSDLPSVGTRDTLTNVLIYDKEPLVDEDSTLVETLQVPDWSSTFSVDGAGNITVTSETFGGAADGLENPSPVGIGTTPTAIASTFGLTNQYADLVAIDSGQSLLGLVPPPVSIDPPPGILRRYTGLELTTTGSGVSAFYRLDNETTWTSFAFGTDTITPPSDTLQPFTVYYYAEKGGARSPIHRADYSWAGEAGTLDSDGDGVPDFVEIQNGLDPTGRMNSDDNPDLTGGSDFDGDGFSDLAELLGGSDPALDTSTPASARPEQQASFDIAAQPLSHDGTVGASPTSLSYAAGHATYNPTELRAYSLTGSLFAEAATDTLGLASPSDPAARLESIPADEPDLFTIISTSTTFDIQSDRPGVGRELAMLVPNPTLSGGDIGFTYDGSSDAPTAAADWLNDAQNHYGELHRHLVSTTIDFDDTLKLFLFERSVHHLLRLRDPWLPDAPLTLTGFRDTITPLPFTDPDREADTPLSVSIDTLRSLQAYRASGDPGWRLHDLLTVIDDLVENSGDTRITALRQLTSELHRLSAAEAYQLYDDEDLANPGLYPSPFDTLRSVVNHLPADSGDVDGDIPLPGDPPTGSPDPATSYSGNHGLTPAMLTAADGAFAYLLTQLTTRPTQTYTATITSQSFEGSVPSVEDDATTSTLVLYDADGDPFRFPDELDLPIGSTIEVLAFTDRSDLPALGGVALEVIEATLTVVPTPSTNDADGNVIDDAWELFFFGESADPWADDDGDGFNNFQEALENTHPLLSSSAPGVAPLPNQPPRVRISRSGGTIRLELDFPSRYAAQVALVLQRSDTLIIPFTEVPSSEATDEGSDTYALELPVPGDTEHFYRFRLLLR